MREPSVAEVLAGVIEPTDREQAPETPLWLDGLPLFWKVSPSQLKTWMRCERKWGWEKLAGIRIASSGGAALGTLVHEDQMEPYLRDGRPLNFSQKDPESGKYPAEIAAVGLMHLPKPGAPGLSVEKYFYFSLPSDPRIVFHGFVDWKVIRPDHALVGDHKTCGNWQYALTADDLRFDPQAIIYAKNELLKNPSLTSVDLKWGYLGTKKPYRAAPVTVTLTRAHVDAVFDEVLIVAREIVTTLRSRPKKQPLELAPNSDACGDYRGCPFVGRCNLPPQERRPFAMSTTSTTATLKDRIEANKLKASQGGVVPAGAPNPAGPSPLAIALANAKAAREAKGPSEAAATLPVGPPPTVSPFPPPAPAVVAAPDPLPAWADPSVTPIDPISAIRPPPPMPTSDQPINPPGDFQAAPATDLERTEKPAAKGPGRPAGAKNKTSPAATLVDATTMSAIAASLLEVLSLSKRALKLYLGEGSES